MTFIQIFCNNIENLIPEFFLSINILFFLLFSLFFSQNPKNQNYNFFKIFLKLVIYSICLTIYLYSQLNDYFVIILFNFFYSNLTIKLIKIFLLFLSICFFFQLNKSVKKLYDIYIFEIILLILTSLLGLFLMLSSYNFISLYVSLEVFSLSFYILVSSNRTSFLSVEAALKYFIYGALASGLILYGISMIYGFTGSLNFSDYIILFQSNNTNYQVLEFSFLLIIIGLLFKVGAAPFHSWLPDVYEGSIINLTMFFILVPKLIIFYILGFILFILYPSSLFLPILIQFFILLSLIIGIFGALYQKKIKRLFAYSTISHTGFILIAFLTNKIDNLKYLFIYIIIYILINVVLWFIFIYFYNNTKIKYITDLSGIFVVNTNLLLYLIVFFFSLAGIPPLMGFYSKYFIIYSAIQESFFLIGCVSILLSCISTFYYLRIIKIIVFDKKFNFYFLTKFPTTYAFILSILIFININFFYYGEIYLNIIDYIKLTYLII